MTWSGHHMKDANDIETRFSNEDGIGRMASIFTEPSKESQQRIGRVRRLMEQLPAREADFVDLYFFRHINQTDIAAIFGVSQPTVCYRLQRATRRIQFILQLPDITQPQLEVAMGEFLEDPLDAKIMVLMWQTTCQSEAAKQLGLTQGMVRHRFKRSVKRMKVGASMKVYADMFDTIADNLNLLREVRRPSWDSRATHVIC